ncbi:MAG: rhodanese-like domain-containing protein, partial [Desulfonatronovibrionaceae bacterium]
KTLSVFLLVLAVFITGCVAKESPKTAYGPDNIRTVDVQFNPDKVPDPFHTIVDLEFVKPFVCDNLLLREPRTDFMLIDSRPKRPRYDRGHIPTAVSIPDSKFEEMTHLLPEDKSTLLIFHCQSLG